MADVTQSGVTGLDGWDYGGDRINPVAVRSALAVLRDAFPKPLRGVLWEDTTRTVAVRSLADCHRSH